MSENAGLSNLLDKVLAIRPEDTVAVLYDEWGADTAHAINRLLPASQTSLQAVGRYSAFHLPQESRRLLVDDVHNVCILCLRENIWHLPERKKAKYELKKRLAWLIAPLRDLRCDCAAHDYSDMRILGRDLFRHFRTGRPFRVTAPGGTCLEARIGQPFLEDGFYDLPGTGGDFPSGEVGFGPQEGSVNGIICYDLKVQHIGCVAAGDIQIRVAEDEIVSVTGHKTRAFEAVLDAGDRSSRFIGEVSLGLNPLVVET